VREGLAAGSRRSNIRTSLYSMTSRCWAGLGGERLSFVDPLLDHRLGRPSPPVVRQGTELLTVPQFDGY
jgi:hypothetical protein